jgi:hypothetical protein
MSPDALETLRQANRDLRSALIRFDPQQRHCSSINPQDFSGLRGQLRRAAECLRRAPSDSEAAALLQKESLEFRGNLQKLKHLLPDVQVRLLAEKSRLEMARAHMAGAEAWAQARKTL